VITAHGAGSEVRGRSGEAKSNDGGAATQSRGLPGIADTHRPFRRQNEVPERCRPIEHPDTILLRSDPTPQELKLQRSRHANRNVGRAQPDPQRHSACLQKSNCTIHRGSPAHSPSPIIATPCGTSSAIPANIALASPKTCEEPMQIAASNGPRHSAGSPTSKTT
jgi:hypothetical protein